MCTYIIACMLIFHDFKYQVKDFLPGGLNYILFFGSLRNILTLVKFLTFLKLVYII